MKKLIIAALAATIGTTPLLAAPFDGHGGYEGRGRIERNHRFDGDRRNFDQHRRSDYRQWQRGDRFDSRHARDFRMISAPRNYRLYDAPRGYRWVQSGSDALLVGITSGIIAAVMANAIN